MSWKTKNLTTLKWVLSVVGGLFMLLVLDASDSPYVLERQKDLIEWRTWSVETRELISKSGKPVVFTISHEFNQLSQAMGKETFSNADIAKQVNEHFIAVALDKNEFPSLAAYFGTYVYDLKQFSGWPLTVFTTPDLNPIDGGGYYPPSDSWGSQGFLSVINSVSEQWTAGKDAVLKKSRRSLEELELFYGITGNFSSAFSADFLSMAVENLGYKYDATHHGFDLAPKAVSFQPLILLGLEIQGAGKLKEQAKVMRDATQDALLNGAVRDYVRGGFFAASVDESWSVPDFRKWLVTQVQAINYFSQFPEHRGLAQEVARTLLNDFRSADGLYSEFVQLTGAGLEQDFTNSWTLSDLEKVLDQHELKAFVECFGVLAEGNVSEDLDFTGSFTGRNILKHVKGDLNSPPIKSGLKKLKAWGDSNFQFMREAISSVEGNVLVISALVKAGFPDDASQLLERVVDVFWDDELRYLHASSRGKDLHPSEATSLGYALMIKSLLDVGGATNQLTAKKIQTGLDERFGSTLGPYLMTARDDNETPTSLYAFLEYGGVGSANSISIINLRRLDELFPDGGYELTAQSILQHLPEDMTYSPEQFPSLLLSGVGK